jgi:hypothetical protein
MRQRRELFGSTGCLECLLSIPKDLPSHNSSVTQGADVEGMQLDGSLGLLLIALGGTEDIAGFQTRSGSE